MSTLLISLLTLVLLLISAFVILIVLMQKTSQSGGMGAALGGGAAESAFGSDTNNILTKGTVYGIIAFFLVALGLYLLYQAQSTSAAPEVDMNSLISSQEEQTAAETNIEAVESSDLGVSSEDLVESVEAVAADAASIDPQPASN
jgi:preprotein translocase subunit SecG